LGKYHHGKLAKEFFMKNISRFSNFILASVLVFLLFSLGIPVIKVQGAAPKSAALLEGTGCDSNRTVHVTGSALINVTPDRALVQLGVQSNGASVDAVQKANTLAIQNVIAAIKLQGVEPKDIATDLYVIEPVYENYDSLYIKGYRINNTVAVTVRDVNKTSAIVAAALAAGANQVNNVGLYTSELRKFRDQARELAITAAREKAQALATASGAETGCVLNISENTWSYYNGWMYGSGRNANQWTQNTVQNATPSGGTESSNDGDEPISLGQISVKAEVSVTYALK
jgi:uncharacterized protein YggE